MGNTARDFKAVPGEAEIRRHRIALRRAYGQGHAAFAPLPLEFDPFARRLLALARRRIVAAGADPDDARITHVLNRARSADVYLAIACDRNIDGAWQLFTERFVPRLRGLAEARGATPAEADELARQIPSELAAPADDGFASTKIGRYDGTASLFSWLAVICLRRLVDRRRASARRPVPVGTASLDLPTTLQADPSHETANAESAERFRDALARSWSVLTRQESLALLLKHRDGLPQTRIAGLLGVGPPRVSRILKSAIEKLKRALSDKSPGEPPEWSALCAAAAEYMETLPRSDELQQEPHRR